MARKVGSPALLACPGDVLEFPHEGFTIRVTVHDDPDRETGDERDFLVGVEVSVHLLVESRGRVPHDVNLGSSSLWGIEGLNEGGYGAHVVAQLLPEALAHARAVLAELAVWFPPKGGK